MTTFSEAMRRLRERNQPDAQPLIFLAHPAMTEDSLSLGYLLGVQAAGYEVYVMLSPGGSLVALNDWISPTDPALPRCVVCGTHRGLKLGRGDGAWRCQSADCT